MLSFFCMVALLVPSACCASATYCTATYTRLLNSSGSQDCKDPGGDPAVGKEVQ